MLLFNRAISKYKLHQTIAALEDCNRALTMETKSLKALLLRAKCCIDIRMFQKAVSDYRTALSIPDVSNEKMDEIRTLLVDAQKAYELSVQNSYFALGVSGQATEDEIKKAYKQLAMFHHPDRHRNEPQNIRDEHEELFKRINSAFKNISSGF